MPQLDISTYASQAFWIILCFSLLWFMMSIFITPKIADILEQRKRKIDDYVKRAEKLNTQVKQSLERYERALREAKAKSAKDIENNRKDSEAFLALEEKLLNERLNEKIAESEFRLAKEKADALQQLDTLSQSVAYVIVQKLGFTDIKKDAIEIKRK